MVGRGNVGLDGVGERWTSGGQQARWQCRLACSGAFRAPPLAAAPSPRLLASPSQPARSRTHACAHPAPPPALCPHLGQGAGKMALPFCTLRPRRMTTRKPALSTGCRLRSTASQASCSSVLTPSGLGRKACRRRLAGHGPLQLPQAQAHASGGQDLKAAHAVQCFQQLPARVGAQAASGLLYGCDKTHRGNAKNQEVHMSGSS